MAGERAKESRGRVFSRRRTNRKTIARRENLTRRTERKKQQHGRRRVAEQFRRDAFRSKNIARATRVQRSLPAWHARICDGEPLWRREAIDRVETCLRVYTCVCVYMYVYYEYVWVRVCACVLRIYARARSVWFDPHDCVRVSVVAVVVVAESRPSAGGGGVVSQDSTPPTAAPLSGGRSTGRPVAQGSSRCRSLSWVRAVGRPRVRGGGKGTPLVYGGVFVLFLLPPSSPSRRTRCTR